MFRTIQNKFTGDQKFLPNVMEKMKREHTAFVEYLEIGIGPMFIFDLAQHQVLAVNEAFERKKAELEALLLDFEKGVLGLKTLEAKEFENENKKFVFNPVLKEGTIILIQILESNNREEEFEPHSFAAFPISKTLINKLPSGILHTNKKFDALWYNDKFKKLFGCKEGGDFNLIDSVYMENVSDFWNKIEKLNQGKSDIDFKCVIQKVKKATEVHIQATAFLLESNMA